MSDQWKVVVKRVIFQEKVVPLDKSLHNTKEDACKYVAEALDYIDYDDIHIYDTFDSEENVTIEDEYVDYWLED